MMIEPSGHLRWEGFTRLFAQVFESDAVYGGKTKLSFPSFSNQHHLQSASVPYACIHGKTDCTGGNYPIYDIDET